MIWFYLFCFIYYGLIRYDIISLFLFISHSNAFPFPSLHFSSCSFSSSSFPFLIIFLFLFLLSISHLSSFSSSSSLFLIIFLFLFLISISRGAVTGFRGCHQGCFEVLESTCVPCQLSIYWIWNRQSHIFET